MIITTAGSPEHFAHQIYTHAYESDLWTVSNIDGPAPWMDPAELEAERQRLPESIFRRLYENQWAEPEDRLVRLEDLQACTTPPHQPHPDAAATGPYLISADIGLKRDLTSVVVSHRDDTIPDRPVVIDRITTWKGTPADPVSLDAVQAHIEEMSAEYGNAATLIDPHQAMHMIQRLRVRGIEASEHPFTQRGNDELAQALYLAIRDHTILLPDNPQLVDELLHIQLREKQPGVWRLDHQPGRHDDMAITVAMATWWHNQQPEPWTRHPSASTAAATRASSPEDGIRSAGGPRARRSPPPKRSRARQGRGICTWR